MHPATSAHHRVRDKGVRFLFTETYLELPSYPRILIEIAARIVGSFEAKHKSANTEDSLISDSGELPRRNLTIAAGTFREMKLCTEKLAQWNARGSQYS